MRAKYQTNISCALVFVLVLIVASALLVGCEDSDVLKEIVYSQESENIDHDNASKVQVESDDAKVVSPKAKPTETSTQASDTTQKIARIEYSSNPNTNLPVPKYIYAKDAKTDSEASEAVSPKESKEKNKEASKTKDGNKDDGKSNKKDDSKDASNSKGNKSDSDSDNSKDDGGGDGKGGGGDVKTYNPSGVEDDMPQANTVAAYGQYAVIVQMLAGAGALVAYDEETAEGKFTKVFSDEGADKIKVAWSGNGQDGSLDIDKLIKAKPDTVLVGSAASFSKSQKEKLAKEDISITTLPSLTSATKIKNVVRIVGKILASSTQSSEDTSSNAQSYCKYHDKIIEESIDACGGYAAYNNVVYDADIEKKPHISSGKCIWTVVINDWDYDARYKGIFSGKSSLVKSSQGVGFAQMGYTASPISFYLGAGGVVNNAAAKVGAKSNQGLQAIVWQFETSKFKVDSSEKWNSKPSSKLGTLCKIDTDSGSNLGSSKVLLNSPNDSSVTGGSVSGLGSDDFPAVIVKSKKMKQAMVADSKTSNGVYTAYERQTLDNGVSGRGVAVGSELVNSAIKTGTNLSNCILVNPQGLLADWMDGSPESFLESVWVSSRKEFGNNWNGTFKSTVKEFYKEFYRYNLTDSDFSDIEDGVD